MWLFMVLQGLFMSELDFTNGVGPFLSLIVKRRSKNKIVSYCVIKLKE